MVLSNKGLALIFRSVPPTCFMRESPRNYRANTQEQPLTCSYVFFCEAEKRFSQRFGSWIKGASRILCFLQLVSALNQEVRPDANMCGLG
jgi:hypothetical protein